MRKTRSAPNAAREPLRLVKTWLPARLVKLMDEIILASEGAYDGRDDFLREAIADRIAEEQAGPDSTAVPLVLLTSGSRASRSSEPHVAPADAHPKIEWNAENLPTLPPAEVSGAFYGLHNRDFPTLWASRLLLSLASSRGRPLPWSEFLRELLPSAWNLGVHLAKMDASPARGGLKTSIGFPTNQQNPQSSEARFMEHMVGVPDRRDNPSGPLFAMQLAGISLDGDESIVAPTPSALDLWRQLAPEGREPLDGPPFPERAWLTFRDHLRIALPEDFQAWMQVLRAISTGVTREELLGMFQSQWPGAAASTNVAAYVSRGREWGLVVSKLRRGKYALTALGERESTRADL